MSGNINYMLIKQRLLFNQMNSDTVSSELGMCEIFLMAQKSSKWPIKRVLKASS